jgi:hypothetical protein
MHSYWIAMMSSIDMQTKSSSGSSFLIRDVLETCSRSSECFGALVDILLAVCVGVAGAYI